jgi:VanZ family protein
MNNGQMKVPYVAMRFIAWACVIGLAVASWTPGPDIVRTGFNTRLEHTAAYLIAGIAVFVAYPRKPQWLIAALLGAYAGVLELGQMYVPGRHSALLDWVASSGGVLCAWITVLISRRDPSIRAGRRKIVD